MESKVCTYCKDDKPLSEYYSSKYAKSGLQSTCKKCMREAAKDWVKKNKYALALKKQKRYKEDPVYQQKRREASKMRYRKRVTEKYYNNAA